MSYIYIYIYIQYIIRNILQAAAQILLPSHYDHRLYVSVAILWWPPTGVHILPVKDKKFLKIVIYPLVRGQTAADWLIYICELGHHGRLQAKPLYHLLLCTTARTVTSPFGQSICVPSLGSTHTHTTLCSGWGAGKRDSDLTKTPLLKVLSLLLACWCRWMNQAWLNTPLPLSFLNGRHQM